VPGSTCRRIQPGVVGPLLFSEFVGLFFPRADEPVLCLGNSQGRRGWCSDEALLTQQTESSIPADCQSDLMYAQVGFF